jgi:hypothetical protein
MAVSFSGGGSRNTRWEPPSLGKRLVSFITWEKRNTMDCVVEEVEVPGENHRLWANNWYTLSLAKRKYDGVCCLFTPEMYKIYTVKLYIHNPIKKTKSYSSSYKHNIYSENKFRHIKSYIQHQTHSKKMHTNYIAEEKYSSLTLFP